MKNVIWRKDWKFYVGNGLDSGLLLVVPSLCYFIQFRRPFSVGHPGALFLNTDKYGLNARVETITLLFALDSVFGYRVLPVNLLFLSCKSWTRRGRSLDYIVIMKGFLRYHKVLWISERKATCKRIQQLPTFLGQQYWSCYVRLGSGMQTDAAPINTQQNVTGCADGRKM